MTRGLESTASAVPAAPPLVPNPAPVSGQYVISGGHYYATGGSDINPLYRGVDTFFQISIPNIPQPTFEIGMWHTSDWVMYHFKIPAPAMIKKIDLCLRNPPNPTVGTPVEVYVNNPVGRLVPYSHEALPPAIWMWKLAGMVKIDQPSWKIYSIAVPTPSGTSTDHFVAVHLKEGEIGPEAGKDRNVYISWVKIST